MLLTKQQIRLLPLSKKRKLSTAPDIIVDAKDIKEHVSDEE